MFFLTLIKDSVKIPPASFGKPILEALSDEIHAKYSNKVIPQIGLGIALHSIESYGDSIVYPSEGSTFTVVNFKLIVYRPFRNEVITGTLANCDKSGLIVSLGFTEVFVPASELQENTVFNEKEQLWVWKYDGNSELWMDFGNEIRMKTLHVNYCSKISVPIAGSTFEEKILPMKVVASIREPGLGMTAWWAHEDLEKSEAKKVTPVEIVSSMVQTSISDPLDCLMEEQIEDDIIEKDEDLVMDTAHMNTRVDEEDLGDDYS